MRRLFSLGFFFLFAAFLRAGDPVAAAESPRRITVFASREESAVRAVGGEIWERGDGFVVAGMAASALNRLTGSAIAPILDRPDEGQGIYLLSHDEFFPEPALRLGWHGTIHEGAALYLFPVDGMRIELPGARLHGKFMGVPRIPLPAMRPHAADLAPPAQNFTAAANPLVQQIVNATSQASWYTFVRELSGDLAVTIPGTPTACTVAGNCRITSRYSDAMFPTPLSSAYATEYLLDKGAGWGFTGANALRENYTVSDSGCTGNQAKTWQNIIFTLPGQVDYGAHQQVLFVNHYDTISYTVAESNTNSPGADDAISGGTALLEAMRLFKAYGFKYTVKFIFFSGEEVGLCGSGAYVRMHPASDMWRVINMDQTAYDGNKNKLMNLYNWAPLNCPGCVAFGDAFVQANSDYSLIINPAANIVRNQTKMCQTDHCPFWNVGVTAIDINEDLTNNDICPCFDNGFDDFF